MLKSEAAAAAGCSWVLYDLTAALHRSCWQQTVKSLPTPLSSPVSKHVSSQVRLTSFLAVKVVDTVFWSQTMPPLTVWSLFSACHVSKPALNIPGDVLQLLRIHCKNYPYIRGFLWQVFHILASLFRRFTDTNLYTEPVSLKYEQSPQNIRGYTDIFAVYGLYL